MRSILLLLTLAANTWSATVTVCASGCTTTSLQTALDTTANCGDTISIKSAEIQTGPFTFTNRGCAGNPITVTSDRAAWLPLDGTRITPSHLANMATLRVTQGGTIVLSGVLDGSGLPANNWNFIGVAFMTTAPTNYYLVQTKSQGYTAATVSQLPYDITFDRCYFYMPLPNAANTSLSQAIWIDGSNVTLKNSFLGDIADFFGNEAHPVYTLNTPGPLLVQNNYITTSSTTLFAGGDLWPDLPGSVPHNITYKYNYSYLPWKWLNDAASPHHADFLANGSLHPCKKNHGEFKFVDTLLWQYNVHENMWNQDGCNGQSYGYTATARNAFTSSFVTPSLGKITFTDSTHGGWSGSLVLTPNPAGPDNGACVNLGVGIGLECHAVASMNVDAKSLVLATPLSTTPGGAVDWLYSYEASGYIANITQTNNVYRNVALGTDNLGTTPGTGIGNSGRLKNITVSNNLYWNPSTYTSNIYTSWWHGSAGEDGFNYSPIGYTFTNNTLLAANTMNSYIDVHAAGHTVGVQPLWTQWNWSNNLAGPSSTYGMVGDDTTGSVPVTMATYMTSSKFQNNGLPGIDARPCGGNNTCSGNLTAAWSDPFAGTEVGILKLRPRTIYSAAGMDGNDLGANFDHLPMISNLRVTPGRNTVSLEFDLSGPVADAGDTQPCVLEVSTSRNLHSDLDTYTVIDELNPGFFKQPDTSARTNSRLQPVLVADRHVIWPIGQAATVLGDDGQDHDLSLSSSTTYYGRLMCYGDTQRFNFSTPPSEESSVSYPLNAKIKVGAPSGTTIVRVFYGGSQALGNSADFPAGTDVSVPLFQGVLTYYKLQYLSGSTVTYTSPVRTLLGGQ